MIGINQVNDITHMSESDLSRKIDAWMRGEWRQELNSKSTLSIYKQFKTGLSEEKFYDNTFGSIILFRARANSLKLGWRNRFQGRGVQCHMCGEAEETLEHFILHCVELQDVRGEFQMENTSIQGVLGFENGVDMEHIKKYLEKMWIKRKNYLDAL